ncbi:hypothetical protein [Alcaligenes sp. SDU_A2]|uniref:hypothetical protein n=1 Tax=Alcaligenes sp. SDU_A2 TaxID=3136634 RepID=UPI00311DF346
MIRKILCICGFAFFSLPLMADEAAFSLNEKLVTRYVQSLGDMLPMLQSVDQGEQFWQDSAPDGVPEALYIGRIERDSDLYHQLNRQAQRHGFSGVDQWAQVGDRVLLTRLYIQERKELDALYESLDELEQDLLNNSRQYSTAELEQIMRTFYDSRDHIRMVVSTRPDAPLVQAHMADLDAALSSIE